MFDDFKTDMTEESIVVKDQLERLDNESASTHKYCEKNCREMETSNTETNERMRELRKELEAQAVINERINSENHALSQTIQEMHSDNENIKNENKALSQTLLEMQTKLVKLEDTFSSTIATKATLHHVHSCNEGWRIFHRHCYLVVEWGNTWDDALAYCENLNSSLAEIRTDEEREFAFELIGDTDKGYWTGATDRAAEGRHVYIYQRSQQLVPENYWYPGEPNKNEEDEHCVVMSRLGGNSLNLFDVQCNSPYRSICVKP